MDIKFIQNTQLKPHVPTNQLKFGTTFTDHMFTMVYDKENGWHDATICPYGPLSLDPSAMVFHYAQEIFEGMKAYRTSENGEIYLFRPRKNFERLNRSCDRLCIPRIDPDFALEALQKLINIDKSWIPTEAGASLYIRPFIIATEPHVGVHPSSTYLFCIILSPVSSYYKEGLNPVTIYIETDYTRACRGGTGFTKCGGNYAASLIGQVRSEKVRSSQVLWLDAQEHKYIEEVGAMNVFFKINGKIVTPVLNGSILPGITRLSVIEFLRSKGYEVEERQVLVDEVLEAANNGFLEEAWGTGTAAVISPIGKFIRNETDFIINDGKIGEISQMLFDEITAIQRGTKPDPFGWRVTLK